MNQIKTSDQSIIKGNAPSFHNLIQQLQDFHKKKAKGTLNEQQNDRSKSIQPLANNLPERRKNIQTVNTIVGKKNIVKSIDKIKKDRVQSNVHLSQIVKNESYIIFLREIFEILGLIDQCKVEQQFSSLLSKAYENYIQKKRNGEWKQLRWSHKKIEKENKIEIFLEGERLEKIKKSYLNLTKGYKFHKYNLSRNKIEESGQCILSSDFKFLGYKQEGKEDFQVYSMKDYLGICDLPHQKQANTELKMPGFRLFFKQDRTIQLITENKQKKQQFIQDINTIKCCL